MKVELPDYYDSLEQTLGMSWQLLEQGATNRRHSFHHTTIATLGLDGAPRIRTVILRQANQQQRSLVFHTDQRSEKITELQADPRIATHFYDGVIKIQLRVEGVAKLHIGDEFAKQRWDASQKISRNCYSILPAPGDTILAGSDYEMLDAKTASLLDQDASFKHFAAVEIIISSLEWLYLSVQGHRRARFKWDAQGELKQNWLVP
jgi:pyridoxamine 5'-phosphate oxidase